MSTVLPHQFSYDRMIKFVYQEAPYRIFFLLVFILVWTAMSTFFTADLLPGPFSTFNTMFELLLSGEFFEHMFATIRRVLISFVIAMGVSFIIGVGMGLSNRIEQFFDIGIVIGLTIPGLAWATISAMIFGLSELTAYFAIFIIVVPIVTINFWTGVKDINPELNEMARVFNFTKLSQLRYVLIPQLLPYLFSAGRFGFAIAWKVAVIVEFIGFGTGIGFQIGHQYNQFRMEELIAWVGLFTLVMILIEFLVFKLLERRMLSWQSESKLNKQQLAEQ